MINISASLCRNFLVVLTNNYKYDIISMRSDIMKVKLVECKKCGSYEVVRAGKVKGNQRYKCKKCGCQFQPNKKHAKPESVKRLAVLLYLLGLSMRTIAKVVKTDLHAVYRWIRTFAEEDCEKPLPKSGTVTVELDEMWHYIHSKTNS
jgi:transposase